MIKILYIVSCLFILLVQPPLSTGQNANESRFDSVYTQYFRRNSGGWTAGDATISIPLPDGRVIWLFGDSYTVNVNPVNNTLPCLFQVRNCMMVQDSVDPSVFKTILDTTMTGVNMTTFKLRPNDTSLFWPGHGYLYNDTVYIFLERYKNTNLQYQGCYVAKLTYPDLHQVAILPVQDIVTDIIFGRAVLPDTSGNWLYIYGNKVNWIIWEPVLARCDISNPMGAWEYYTGTGWSPDPGEVNKIGNDPVSPGYSVFRRDNIYYLITQENGYLECGLGRDIYSYVSPYAWGPFSGKTLLYTEESKFNDAYLLTYNGQAHPWNTENDELLVSYNVNDRVDTLPPYICPSQCKDIWTDRLDADTYRPKFIRVPMGLITSNGNPTGAIQQQCLRVNVLQHPVNRNSAVQLEINTLRPWTGQVRLTNLYGRTVWTKPFTLPGGESQATLPAPPDSGMYFIEFTGNPECGRVVKLVVK
jgi:hypothetical protein